MANSSGVASMSAITEELPGVLVTKSLMLARIRVAAINHLAGIDDDIIATANLLALHPVLR